jgi:hypothetical protein
MRDAAEYPPYVSSTLLSPLQLYQLAYASIASPINGGEALKQHSLEMIQLLGLQGIT